MPPMRWSLVLVPTVLLAACGRNESVTAHTAAEPEHPVPHPTGVDNGGAVNAQAPLSVPRPRLASAVDHEPTSPFGIASSHQSSLRLADWLPVVRSAGVTWLRGFDVSAPELRLTEAERNGVQVSGFLVWGPSGKPLTLPVDDLAGWSNRVTQLVSRCKDRVHHWEIWNEPPNFTEDKSPESYAKIVVAAYDAIKRVDPNVQVGIAAKSNHVQWLETAIRAGAKGHFDYVTLHPYEVLDKVAQGGEALFINIVPTLRRMLRANDPERENAPIWFTELGTPVSATTTPELQAARLLKAYTLSIAQGVEHVFWFEGQDGDSGPFGLLDAGGKKRLAFTALQNLIANLGGIPDYVGWVEPVPGTYGFVFRNRDQVVLVAWAWRSGKHTFGFDTDVTAMAPTTGTVTRTRTVDFGTVPVIVTGLPTWWSDQADANSTRPFPWGGDYSAAQSVSVEAPDVQGGLHQFGEPRLRSFDGQPARDASPSTSQNFAVDPNFASYVTGPLKISVTARRNGTTPAGYRLKYESTSGWKAAGEWYQIPESNGFTTKEFVLNDAEFVGNWAYHFMLDSDSTRHSQYSIQKVTVSKL